MFEKKKHLTCITRFILAFNILFAFCSKEILRLYYIKHVRKMNSIYNWSNGKIK